MFGTQQKTTWFSQYSIYTCPTTISNLFIYLNATSKFGNVVKFLGALFCFVHSNTIKIILAPQNIIYLFIIFFGDLVISYNKKTENLHTLIKAEPKHNS